MEKVSPQQFLASMYGADTYSPVLSALPVICEYNYAASIILARILYWNDKLKVVIDGDRVLVKSREDLSYETGVEVQTVGRCCRYLKDAGLIDFDVKWFNKQKKMYIKVNLHVLFQKFKERVETETGEVLEIPEYLLQAPSKKLKVRKL